jgi:hypothetical protein
MAGTDNETAIAYKVGLSKVPVIVGRYPTLNKPMQPSINPVVAAINKASLKIFW